MARYLTDQSLDCKYVLTGYMEYVWMITDYRIFPEIINIVHARRLPRLLSF